MRRLTKVLSAIIAGGAIVACSVEQSSAPAFTGPSEFALSVTLTATPDQLPRDGSSQSVVTVIVRDEAGRPVSGQRLAVTSNVGTVSQTEVVTGDDGRATFAFVAPGASNGSNTAVVRAVPAGENFQNQVARTVTIALTGTSGVTSTTAPTADFSDPAPSAPTIGDLVTFDATASKDEGIACLDLCTYSWDFGGEATGTGRIVTYRFKAARTYAVTLTVTDGAGSIGTKTKNVAVTEGDKPTASITFSPSDPAIFEPVNFTGEGSTAGQAGRTIVSHQWQFGDGTSATGLRVSKTYNVIGTYTVTLTVTDSAGFQGTDTEEVEVVSGITAEFEASNPTDGSLVVYFNAEKSKGSSSGFGSHNLITKYIWHFGDSNDEEETSSPRISHTFGAATAYKVTLTVEDSAGRRAVDSETITVAN